eukprot:3955373-Pyramimonas_sp.AAC.3
MHGRSRGQECAKSLLGTEGAAKVTADEMNSPVEGLNSPGEGLNSPLSRYIRAPCARPPG